jgi:DNA-directed RNA polymerase subunit RPC12/RpoP
MEPNEVSRTLRRIATAILRSESPSRSAVLQDLQKLVSRIAMNMYGYQCTRCNHKFLNPMDTAKNSGVSCPMCKGASDLLDPKPMTASELSGFMKEEKRTNRTKEKEGEGPDHP